MPALIPVHFERLNEVLLYIIKRKEKKLFLKKISNFSKSEKTYFCEFIIWNKLSSVLLDFVNLEELNESLDQISLKKIEYQKTKFQIQSISIVEEVLILNDLLRTNNFNGIFLKGVALSLFEYKDISFRPMMDIDILIEKENILDFYEILTQKGYTHSDGIVYSKEKLKEYLISSHQLPELKSKKNISIDLHHRSTKINSFEHCPLSKFTFENHKSKDFMNTKIKVPDENSLLLNQLLHLSSYPEYKFGALSLQDYFILNQNYNYEFDTLIKSLSNKIAIRNISLSLSLFDFILDYTNRIKKNKVFSSRINDHIILIAFNKFYEIPKKNLLNNSFPFFLIQNKTFIGFISFVLKKFFPSKREMYYIFGERILNTKFFFFFYFLHFINLNRKYYKDAISIFFGLISQRSKLNDYKKLSNWLKSLE